MGSSRTRVNGEKGQQIMEFLILVAALLVVLILFIGPKSPTEKVLNEIVNAPANWLDQKSEMFKLK